jgi:hypothetical protein
MTTIVTRAGKGSALTHNEVDTNFTNLNSAKYESGNNATLGTIQGSTITATTGFSGNLTGDTSGAHNGTVGATTPAAGTFTNLAYTGTLTGGTGVINIGSGQVYKDASGNVGIGTISPSFRFVISQTNLQTGSIPLASFGVSRQLFIQPGLGGNDVYNSGIGFSAYFDTAAATPQFILPAGRSTNGGAGISSSNVGDIDFYTYNAGNQDAATVNLSTARKMRITTAGNVGIGTVSPSYKLDVAGQIASQDAYLITVNSSGTPSAGAFIFRPASNTIALGTASTERMRIDSSGNVGIGTSSPSARLNVGGGSLPTSGSGYSLGISSALGATRLTTDASSKTNYIGSFYDDTAIEISQGVTSGYVSGIVIGGRSATNATVSDAIALYTRSLERMRITSTGNVGIGTSSPNLRLEVGGASTSTTNAGLSNMQFYAGFNGSPFGGVVLGAGLNGNSPTVAASRDGSGNGLPLLFFTDGSERMRIDSSGNVGIGTSSSGAKLEVSGSIRTSIGSGGTLSLFETTTPRANHLVLGSDGSGSYINATYATGGSGIIRFQTVSSERMRITDVGEVWIAGTTDRGAFNLQCNGTGVWGAGAYTNGSDARIKEEIEPISSSLEVVNKLNPVTFKYKENWSSDRATQTGFIAQELQEALADEVYIDGVVNDTSEYMSVAYQNIIPILTKAIQELSAKVEALEAQLNKE